MPKKTILLFIVLSLAGLAKAQTADEVYDQYLDFNLKRFENKTADALKLGDAILPNADKLPPKSQISFYNGLAKMFEDDNQSVEAIPLYERVVVAQPDYYVAHRALGYLYAKSADELYVKLQLAGGDAVLTARYKTAVQKALPHLEKAQACDPSDETLALIKKLYANIHDDAGLQLLNQRLKALGKKCLDILTE